MAPRVYTIPPHLPFADTLAKGLLARARGPHGSGSAEALARMTVLLPTRRAGRAVREAFLRESGGRPLLLPRLTPLRDVDEEELILTAGDGAGNDLGAGAGIPPAISTLRRKLLLAELIQKFQERRGTEVLPDQAAWLAGDLARLLDEMQTERKSVADLAKVVPDQFAHHWQQTLDFLAIVTREWPAILAEEGALDPAEHRNRLLAAQAAAWRAAPPPYPVFAAGSTGSIPATADLLKTVAGLPQGAVILPGLDTGLDDAAWRAAAEAPSHPQHGLARLLDHFGIGRADVASWDEAAPTIFDRGRTMLFSAALRPAEAPPRRPGEGLSADLVSQAMSGEVSYLECASPREEAGAIALMLREQLETPGATAALVTPDRDLARRVAAALRRWNVAIDDSAGVPLAATPPMTYLRLVLAAAENDFAPVPLLAVLKHPLAAAGTAPGMLRAKARALEKDVLRGPRPGAGFEGLKAALTRDQRKFFDAWIDDLAQRWAPLIVARAKPRLPAAEWLRAHAAAAEALAADDVGPGARRLWAGEAGETAAELLGELQAALTGTGALQPDHYAEWFEAMIAEAAVRPRQGAHPRLAILGPLEARLQRFDLTVLAGLNEGTWPATISADPWMSRPMRHGIGLPLAERRIGLSAHDFVQAAMAPHVVLTRSLRQAGQPTRPSRWLLRIEAELDGLGLFDANSQHKAPSWRRGDVQAIARELDHAPFRPVPRPAPCPPVEARPRSLYVTDIERWRRDPYAIYARHILGLEALPPLDDDPAAADLGSALHATLEAFLAELKDKPVPANGYERLMQVADDVLTRAELMERPNVRAFWRPRFERIARWFVAAEAERRKSGTLPVLLEKKGKVTLRGPRGDFILGGKADRIDRDRDKNFIVLDYKTGAVPNAREIELGFAPQLALGGLIAEDGGFPGVKGRVARFEYWRLAGKEGGKIAAVKADAGALIAAARTGLLALIARYDDPTTCYPAVPLARWASRFNDYAQLARSAEWGGGGGE